MAGTRSGGSTHSVAPQNRFSVLASQRVGKRGRGQQLRRRGDWYVGQQKVPEGRKETKGTEILVKVVSRIPHSDIFF